MKKLLIVLLMFGLSSPSLAQSGDGTDTQFTVSVFKPEKVEATRERIASLKVPEGFKVSVFAKDLKNARIIAVSKQGFIYVSRRDQGDVLLLKDENGDGKADGDAVKVVSRPGAHGLAIKDDQLFIVTVKEVFVAGIRSDGTLSEPKLIISDLPDSGQQPQSDHRVRTRWDALHQRRIDLQCLQRIQSRKRHHSARNAGREIPHDLRLRAS
jgi:glucose/arabinose dehydrogenase